MKALIVDGDAYTRLRLGVVLRERSGLEVVGECEGAFDAVEAHATMAPDLLVVGAAPKDLDPLEVLVAVADLTPTRHLLALPPDSDLAIHAREVGFEVVATPVDRATVHRALDRLAATPAVPAKEMERRLRQLLDRIGRPSPHTDRLVVRSNRRVEFVPTREIDWIGAARNYVRLHVGQTTHVMRSTMRALEQRLSPRDFLRIHRSIIVNVDRMREIQPWFHGEAVVILEDGTRLNLSRGYRPKVERYLTRVARGIG